MLSSCLLKKIKFWLVLAPKHVSSHSLRQTEDKALCHLASLLWYTFSTHYEESIGVGNKLKLHCLKKKKAFLPTKDGFLSVR